MNLKFLTNICAKFNQSISLIFFIAICTRALEIKKIPVVSVTGVDGGNAHLSCDVSHPSDDSIVLLLWFRDGRTTPIYRYDARSSSVSSSHWADESLAGRASLNVSQDPAQLELKALKETDAGFYRCRVDFQKQPTKTTRINLSVVVPPVSVSVYQDSDFSKEVTRVVGPYKEGDMLSLTCVSEGGLPIPQVVWFEDTRLLDSVMESHDEGGEEEENDEIHPSSNATGNAGENETTEKAPTNEAENIEKATKTFAGKPFNTLTLGPLIRSHLKMLLTCEAANNNITLPTSQVVMIDMNLPPLGINVKTPEMPFEAQKEYQIECEVYGGRPPPQVTWWRANEPIIDNTFVTTTTDGNITTNVFRMTPKPSDDGSMIKCRAEGKATSTVFEKKLDLTVHYVPKAEAKFGASLDSSNIKEGDDVYFECLIDANPKSLRVSWRHNNKVLNHNVTEGIIISNQSLVLQRVTKDQAGVYTCHAYNILGDGVSNTQRLDVKYSPVCSPNQVTTYAVSRHEDAEVTCKVDANPPEASFQWTFNNTADTIDVPNGRYTTASSHSVITYTPVTSLDYGTLLCWASNDIGVQREPCLFHIVPAGKPDAPSNCTITRRLRTSVKLLCIPGNNGGFDQVFHLQVSQEGRSIYNITHDKPGFKVDNLTPGQKYRFTITAENERGSSFPTHLSGYTRSIHGAIYKDGPSEAEVRDGGKNGNSFIPPNTSSSSSPSSSSSSSSSSSFLDPLDLNSIMPVAVGVGAGLILIIIVLIVLIAVRARLPRNGARRSHSEHTILHGSHQGSIEETSAAIEEKMHHDLTGMACHQINVEQTEGDSDNDPDIIPIKEELRGPPKTPSESTVPPVTLLPPEQYSFSVATIRQSHNPISAYETSRTRQKMSMSPSGELLCSDPPLKSSWPPVAETRLPTESSTLPRRLHCPHHHQHHHQETALHHHYHHLHHYHDQPGKTEQVKCHEKRCSIADLSFRCYDDTSTSLPPINKRESSV